MIKFWTGALLVLGLLGCSSDGPPGASVAANYTLPDSALARMRDVSLLRAGDSFTMAGYENGQVRWGRVSLAGVVTNETGFDLPKPLVGPTFAATMKSTPGDQLIVLVVNNSTASPGGYDLSAIVQNVGSALTTTPKVLYTFTAPTDVSAIQLAAGAATTGNVGFVAWSVQAQWTTVKYLMLSADAATAATAAEYALPRSDPAWVCLGALAGTTGLGFSVVAPVPGFASWLPAELNESGAITSNIEEFQLLGNVKDCRIMGSPTSKGGYDIAFQDTGSIALATYFPTSDPTKSGPVITSRAISNADYPDSLSVPQPAWVSPAGNDVSLGLMRLAGPQVQRFSYNADRHGSALALPSVNGNTGPVASWVAPSDGVNADAVYVTYTDTLAATGTAPTPSIKRYFLKIESPLVLP